MAVSFRLRTQKTVGKAPLFGGGGCWKCGFEKLYLRSLIRELLIICVGITVVRYR